MGNNTLNTYEILATEYYDSARHPTCANFRQASYFIIDGWLQLLLSQNGRVCEVGSGKSIIAELMTQHGHIIDNLFLVDSSPSMLAYSNHGGVHGAKLILSNAEKLPIPSGSIAVVVSSLGDPYNSPQFWRETSRILKRGGLVLFTTPSYEWAVAFRGESEDAFTTAEFELVNGRRVRVPSIIHPIDEQIQLIESKGFAIEEVSHVAISALDRRTLSPKLSILQKSGSRVVSGYLARKSSVHDDS